MQRILIPLVLCLIAFSTCSCWGIGLPPNTQIHIVATADYTNVYNEQQSADPASVTLTVLQIMGAKIEWQPPQEVITQGVDVYVPVTITNTGNGQDTFDLTAVSAHGWHVALIYDDYPLGTHQDSEQWEITNTSLAADGFCPCFAKVTIPNDAITGDTVTIRAVSRQSPAQGSATQDIPIASPGMLSTRLDLTASPVSPIVGQVVTVHGQISPIIRETVHVTITDPSGAPRVVDCMPGVDGAYTTTFTPSQAGDYAVHASYPGNTSHMASVADLTVTAVAKTATTIEMQTVPTNPTVGTEVAVSGTLSPAMAATVTLTYQPPTGAATNVEVTTDQFGRFCSNKSIDAAGTWTISASYAGDTTFSSSQAQATVQAAAQQAPHAITFQTTPEVSPNTVAYPESTQCTALAADSASHTIQYAWSDGGAGGTFTPSANVASPAYLAAANRTPQNVMITLTCTATCSQDTNVATVASATLTVRPTNTSAPSVLSVTPQSGTAMAELGTDILIRFSEAMTAGTTQQAISFSPAVSGASYTWDASGTILTISHQALTANTQYTCTISTGAQDASGTGMLTQYQWAFSTVPAIRFDPNEVGAAPSTTFATPAILVSDPSLPPSVSFKIVIPEGLVVNNAPDADGNLLCVKKGADVSDFQSVWDSSRREIAITATVTTPSVSTEVVKTIRLGAPAAAGTYQLLYQGTPALRVGVHQLLPGDFNGDGLVNITDAIKFTQTWTRWQGDPQPAWDADVDEPFDLAPHTDAAWPTWTPIGDHIIDSADATAFTECWNGSHSASASTSSTTYRPTVKCLFSSTKTSSDAITVKVEKASGGLFEASVKIPDDARFDSSMTRNGGLVNVTKGPGSGTVFFSEYDPATHTVRLAGTTNGNAPYAVAVIRISK